MRLHKTDRSYCPKVYWFITLDIDCKCNPIILPPHLITHGSFTGMYWMESSKSNFTPGFYFCFVILSWMIFLILYMSQFGHCSWKWNYVSCSQSLKLKRSHLGSREECCASSFEMQRKCCASSRPTAWSTAPASPGSINGLFVRQHQR